MSVRNEFRFALAQWGDNVRRRMGICLYHYADAQAGELSEVLAFADELGIKAQVVWSGNMLNVWRFKCQTKTQQVMCKLRWGKSPIWEMLQRNRDDH